MLRSFVLFTKLPIEIQNLIWEFTLSDPRAISRENCFREWWYGRITTFLSPVALHVCHSSRSLAKSVLRCTSVYIPGLPGKRLFYINQDCDFLYLTKQEIQLEMGMSTFITDPTLIRRVVISGILLKDLDKDMKHYFDQFSGLGVIIQEEACELSKTIYTLPTPSPISTESTDNEGYQHPINGLQQCATIVDA
jgi:hypothetical protein